MTKLKNGVIMEHDVYLDQLIEIRSRTREEDLGATIAESNSSGCCLEL